ncbi:MAG: primosomal protein N' [Cycloclasticus sp.]
MSNFYLNIAVDTPLHRIFDYLPINNSPRSDYQAGQRVSVSFGRRQKIGVILNVSSSTDIGKTQLKPISKLLDAEPLLSPEDLKLYQWAANYYHSPIGEVFAQTLPKQLRSGKEPTIKLATLYSLSQSGHALDETCFNRSPRQRALWQQLKSTANPVDRHVFATLNWDWRSPINSMIKKGWVDVQHEDVSTLSHPEPPLFSPNSEQQAAIKAISKKQQAFQVFLLDGVTGSGKTEVYLQLIQQVINNDKQVLILLPEITLTPQLAERFRKRLATQMVVSHSGLNDSQRSQAWLRIKKGLANILLGTRSAVFTPMSAPGMIIMDEEHDPSFKQQEGFRYSARNVAIMRARDYNIPIVLGSATPSLESLHNVQQNQFTHLVLTKRTAGASPPVIRLLDCRHQTLDNHLSPSLLNAIKKTLERNEQVILFVNRRGFAPVLMCHRCGWVGECRRCDSRLVIHKEAHLLKCHHCGTEHSIPSTCPSCQEAELFPLGLGTERVEETLNSHFPDTPITRIDRDSTRQKDAMQSLINQVRQGGGQILVGTQMLAKGHHFPNVTLVGIVDIDAGLFSCDFRASERMAQLITQVAGRAGREEKPGRVLIQTHQPEHPLLNTLIEHGYARFAKDALAERQQAQLPPYHYHALLRVNAVKEQAVLNFLTDVGHLISNIPLTSIQILGPVPAPMLKRAGRFRYQLLIESPQRKARHQFLKILLPELEKMKSSRQVRWSIDVDPIDIF